MEEKDKERFSFSYVEIDGCWMWRRGMFRDGYGAFVLKGKTRRAHRVAYELVHDVVLTPDQFLHHICKNKACVNPDHLEITYQLTHVDSAVYGNKQKLTALTVTNIPLKTPIGIKVIEGNACNASLFAHAVNMSATKRQ